MQERVGKKILLVGTAHISAKSVEEVREAIRKFKPDIVAVELCKDRYKALIQKNRWEKTSVIDVIRSGKGFLVLIQTFLAMTQRKMGKELGVEPGSEMLAAIQEARKAGIQVALVDRKITTTFRRAWGSMTFREKLRLAWHSMKALVGYDRALEEEGEEFDLEELMKEDVITMMMEELRSFVPNATYALIDERDMFIAKRIKQSSEAPAREIKGFMARYPFMRTLKDKKKESEARAERGERKIKKLPKPPRKVIGVVGAGHLKGIRSYLEGKKELPEISTLTTVPKKRFSVLKTIGYLIPILFAVMFVYLIFFGEWEKLKEFLFWWFMINGICSAIGTVAAKGHPASIAAAFLAAPFTSLNPSIGAGWVAGYVEAKIRNPTVQDVRKLSTIESFGEFFNNKFIRVLMVMALANLGSMIGTVVAFPYITSIFLS
jgi:pheromone shutdown protein TraB